MVGGWCADSLSRQTKLYVELSWGCDNNLIWLGAFFEIMRWSWSWRWAGQKPPRATLKVHIKVFELIQCNLCKSVIMQSICSKVLVLGQKIFQIMVPKLHLAIRILGTKKEEGEQKVNLD